MFRQNQYTQCKSTHETANLLASCTNIVEILRRLWVSSHYKITFFGSLLESNMVYTFRLFVFVFIKNVPAFASPVESVQKSLVSWTTLFATRILFTIHFILKSSNNGLRIFRILGISFTWCLHFGDLDLPPSPTVQFKSNHFFSLFSPSKNALDNRPIYTRKNYCLC